MTAAVAGRCPGRLSATGGIGIRETWSPTLGTGRMRGGVIPGETMLQKLKAVIREAPMIGPPLTRCWHFIKNAPREPFLTSQHYWESRYSAGGTSGSGSVDRLARFKAEVLNTFVR